MVVFMGTKSGKGSDHLPHWKICHSFSRFASEKIQSLSCCRRSLFVFDVNGRWSDEQIAMNRRCYEHTLAKLIRQWEDCVRHMISGRLIQETVIAPPRRNMNLFFTDHIMEPIRINTGCIDNNPRLKNTLIRSQYITSIDFLNILNLCI